jgi:metal-sulfur cluster biosynthetic enzyme
MNPSSFTEAAVWEALRQVVDPELGCNIVDLGLVYGIRIDGTKVTVTMTLTTPGCPLHESLAWGVRNALLAGAAADEVEVELVWDPPWTPERMTDAGRDLIGSISRDGR